MRKKRIKFLFHIVYSVDIQSCPSTHQQDVKYLDMQPKQIKKNHRKGEIVATHKEQICLEL